MLNDEGWWFQAVVGFWGQTDGQTNERRDICKCRVALVTEKPIKAEHNGCYSSKSWDSMLLGVCDRSEGAV